MNCIYRKVWSTTSGRMALRLERITAVSTSRTVDPRAANVSRLRLLSLAIGWGLLAAVPPTVQAQSVAMGGITQCLSNFVPGAPRVNCVEVGSASASGGNAVAIGTFSVASAANSVALGANAVANRISTVSVGRLGDERQITNLAAGVEATDAVNVAQLDVVARYFKADGNDDGSDDAQATGAGATAAGVGSEASGAESVALGSYNAAVGDYASAVGYMNVANGENSSAMGHLNQVEGESSSAFGYSNSVEGSNSVVIGSNSRASGNASLVVGDSAEASADNAIALGAAADASAINTVALGAGSVADRVNTISVGAVNAERQIVNVAAGTQSTDAVNKAQLDVVSDAADDAGRYFKSDGLMDGSDDAQFSGAGAMAIGRSAVASADNAVALGAGSIADRDNAISVGAVNAERQIINVAAGTQTTDAVNMGQLDAVSDAADDAVRYFKGNGLGDGSDDAAASGIDAVAIGRDAVASAFNAVALGAGSMTDRDNTISVGAVNAERQIVNVAAGTQTTDAVNMGQLDAVSDAADDAVRYFKGNGLSDGSDDAIAAGIGAVAIGRSAAVLADNAVALGAGSFADRANTISVGAVNAERQITNVAAGTESTDAVNKAQLDAVSVAANDAGRYFKSDGLADGSDDAQFSGVGTVAIGRSALASADNAVALGAGSVADRDNTISVGAVNAERQITNVAAGTQSTDAVNKAQLDAVSVAAGGASRYFKSNGADDGSDDATASGLGASAAGVDSLASGAASAALGNGNVATGDQATAVGYANAANGENSSAVGSLNRVDGQNSSAFGFANRASGTNALALGSNSSASGNGSMAAGNGALANGINAVALGSGSQALEDNVISVGGGDGSNGPLTRRIVNVGDGRVADDSTDAINGRQLNATNQRVSAVETRVDDFDARIESVEGVAINAVTYDDAGHAALTLSGTQGTTVNNVASGDIAAGSRQAINGGQLYDALGAMAGVLGGGAALGMQGVFVAPTYVIQGASYNTVGDALNALDGHVSTLTLRVAQGGTGGNNNGGGVVLGNRAIAPDVAGVGIGHDAHAAGRNGTALGSNARVLAEGGTAVGANAAISAGAFGAVAVGDGATVATSGGTAIGSGARVTASGAVAVGQGSVADRANTLSVGSAGRERQIVHVAAGIQGTDAVNKSQLDSGIASANTYTDSRFAGMNDRFDLLRTDMGERLRHVDRRIDRQGAMNAAMLNMSTSMAGVRTENRVGVGVGFQGGESSLSIGYQRAFSDRATLTIGGAFSSDDSSVGMGAGFGW